MIRVTRFDGSQVAVNALLIERVEQTPDTVITLTSGRQFVVKESPEEVIVLVVGYLLRLRSGDDPGPGLDQISRVSN